MKEPKHYWAAYLAAVFVVLGAMSWLSVKAIELERAEGIARREAELDESTVELAASPELLNPTEEGRDLRAQPIVAAVLGLGV